MSERPPTPPSGKVTLGRLDKVGSDLQTLFLDEETADVLVSCNNEQIVAHRTVLLARCRKGFFGTRLAKRWRKHTAHNGNQIDVLELNDFEMPIVRKVLEFVYTGTVVVENSQMIPIAITGDFLQIDSLVSLCAEKLVGTATFENAFETLDAISGRSPTFRPAVDDYVAFIGTYASRLFNDDEMLTLGEPAMNELLRSDAICLCEDDIFDHVVKWGLHNVGLVSSDPKDWPEEKYLKLKEVLHNPCSHIRLPLVTIKHLIEVVEPTALFSSEDLLLVYRTKSVEYARQVGEMDTATGLYWRLSRFRDTMSFEADFLSHNVNGTRPREFFESPKIRLGSTDFCVNIKYYPLGLDEGDPEPSCGLYLKVTPRANARVSPEWKLHLKYRLLLNDGSLTRSDSANGALKSISHTFSRASLDWGYKKFTKVAKIQDLVSADVNGVLTFRVTILSAVDDEKVVGRVEQSPTARE